MLKVEGSLRGQPNTQDLRTEAVKSSVLVHVFHLDFNNYIHVSYALTVKAGLVLRPGHVVKLYHS